MRAILRGMSHVAWLIDRKVKL